MKRWIKIVFLLLVMVMCVPVFAVEHQIGDVIPASESATIKTDLFTYTEMSYSSTVTGKEYGRFSFQSITNVSATSLPISIDILLFDAKKENIGFLTYCTDQDFGGDYAQKKLAAGASTSFYINATSRYFVEEKGPADVMYYAVLDDNEYCHVGGYDKYAGLTMEEIVGGLVVKKNEDGSTSTSFDTDSIMKFFSAYVLILIGTVLASIIIQGLILNALHKRMFAKTTVLSYIPIASQYIAVKLAFGANIAKIYIIGFVVSIFLSMIIPIISIVVSIVSSIAFIIDIIKLISKNYTLCYMEPLEKNGNVEIKGNYSAPEEITTNEEVEESTEEEETSEEDQILNLNYGTDTETDTVTVETESTIKPESNIGEESDGFSFDAEDLNSSVTDDQEPEKTIKPEKNVQEGESDLMNLFK